MTEEFSYDVFISYSHRDTATVHCLAERLREDGLKIWLDDWIISPGTSIPLAIEQGLEKSRILLICMSGQYFVSEWTSLERYTIFFRDPANLQTRFIPILLEDCNRPMAIAHFACVDWRNKGKGEYQKLLTTCHPLLSPHVASPQKTEPRSDWVQVAGGRYEVGVDLPASLPLFEKHNISHSQRSDLITYRRQVKTIRTFNIATRCVTNADFLPFVRQNPQYRPSYWKSDGDGYVDNPLPENALLLPVVNVTGTAARQYCIWKQVRLPCWYEWEAAAAGSRNSSYPWGNNFDKRRCNCGENNLHTGRLLDVHQHEAGDSPLGIRQMAGNVFEWVLRSETEFELRGGSFKTPCELWGLTYTFKKMSAEYQNNDAGFRVAIQ